MVAVLCPVVRWTQREMPAANAEIRGAGSALRPSAYFLPRKRWDSSRGGLFRGWPDGDGRRVLQVNNLHQACVAPEEQPLFGGTP